MAAYPAQFDNPCICAKCGQDVEGEPGCTCPGVMSPSEFRKHTGLELKNYVLGANKGNLQIDISKLNEDLNKGIRSYEGWLCEMFPELDQSRRALNALKQHIHKVRILRAREKNIKARLDARKAAWARDNKTLLEAESKSKAAMIGAEDELRRCTVLAYQKTGLKKPAEGVGIRIHKELSYDTEAVRTWAFKEHPGFLMLDKETFETYTKAMLTKGIQIPGILLQEVEVVQATISQELK